MKKTKKTKKYYTLTLNHAEFCIIYSAVQKASMEMECTAISTLLDQVYLIDQKIEADIEASIK